MPNTVATSAADGTPNVTYISQVHYVDSNHVALSFQFFNKTRENILANPRASALVIDPETGAQYRLDLEYLRTETEGPLYESMKARLSGIASQTGMSGVFKLRGADVYRVLEIEAVPGRPAPTVRPRRNILGALRQCSARLNAATDLGGLLDATLAGLDTFFDIHHAIILMTDPAKQRLYTVASRGYTQSGVGSEIVLGCGVIGVAAQQRSPIRITHLTAEYSYTRAIRDSIERAGLGASLETAIPLPGLAESRSQLAVPIVSGNHLFGVLYVESPEDLRFNYDDEDALVALAAQLGTAANALLHSAENDPAWGGPDAKRKESAAPSHVAVRPPAGSPASIRHYASDDSVFIDEDYLIKGVAGAIFWKLVRAYDRDKRVDFSNRELRLDASLGLPDITDNLEARLILLERRLSEKLAPMRIEKTGRGRFRLRVDRPFALLEA
ncbi:MAG TPA: GAF domain-containing protein [Gemmatimonadaceae bacterium]|nr:GAF domain-containing protein [Gemmatimonadaceae bacterium]